jgi:aldose 1-epimerase
MAFQVRTEQRAAGARDGTVYVLEDSTGGSRAEIWPAFGFNCYCWQVARDGRRFDFLYADPQLFGNSSPTRSGIPVLFPFPNRLRDGRFSWEGKTYQLPLNDSAGKNAIHGFACRRPWRVAEQGADATGAWVVGEFRGSRDAPEARTLWPADYELRLTYRLGADRLRLTATVRNPDTGTLPFGLGYHPYFRVAPTGGSGEDCRVTASAAWYWELCDALPTGVRLPVDEARNLNGWRRYADLHLDDVLTELPTHGPPGPSGLYVRGAVREGSDAVVVCLLTSADFRELVAFTPAHRQAVCLEPYTCTTDALNLQQGGIGAGLQVLPPGATWVGVVELRAQVSVS